MNLLLIGCGYWGSKLLQAMKKNQEIETVSIYDVGLDKEEMNRYLDKKVKLVADFDDALAAVDGVVIATPEETHSDFASRSLLQGKHVLVEKPMALTSKDANKLVEIAKDQGLCLMVDHTFLYDQSLMKIDQMITEQEIGCLCLIQSYRFSVNIRKPKINVAVDLMPHDLSIFGLFTDFNDCTVGVVNNSLTDTITDDVTIRLGFANFRTESYLSWRYPENKREMVFYGDKGVIVWKKLSPTADMITKYLYTRSGDLESADSYTIDHKSDTLSNVVQKYVWCIKENKQSTTSGVSVLPQIQLLEKINRKI